MCRYHGGGAPQVRAAARDRLRAMAHDAIDALARALEHDDMRSAVRAAQLVLDRAGVEPVTDAEAYLREQVPTLASIITSVLARFGLDARHDVVAAVVRDELRRVAGVDVINDGNSVDVHRVSAATRERVASELSGEAVEPDTVIM